MKKKARPRAEILTIGSELLKGNTLNTNAFFLGRELTDFGFSVIAQHSCPDDIPAILEALRDAFVRSEVVIITGGLGPTPDDVTREAIAEYFHTALRFSPKQYRQIESFYKARKKRVPVSVKKEALFPANAVPLINRYGIALGFYIKTRSHLAVVLPGVPREQEKMYRALVKPLFKKLYPDLCSAHHCTARILGHSEPRVMERLGKTFFRERFDFGIYPYAGEVIVRVQSDKMRTIASLKRMLGKRLGKDIYSYEEEPLASVIGRMLAKKKKTVAAAESCTGGMFSSEIASIAGASRYFLGSVIAYSNEIKANLLGVPEKVISSKGAVSRETAAFMARGVREKMRSDFGVSITGIAGPGGGSKSKPVGTVFIGVSTARGAKAVEYRFSGDRIHIQKRSVHKALELLWRALL